MCVREEEDECRARGKAGSSKSRRGKECLSEHYRTTGGHSILLRLIILKQNKITFYIFVTATIHKPPASKTQSLSLSLKMGCCGDKDEILTATTTAESATAMITTSSNLSSVLTYRDTLRLILERLGGGDGGVSELARASCVCRVWNSVAYELVVEAFKAKWKLGDVIGKPVSGSFWRDSGIWKFAISHRIVRGDSVASLAVKYSVQVMDIKRLNNMMSDHGIYSRERLLIPISNPDILVNGLCYIELDTYAKREVAVLYLEGGPSGNSSHMLNKMTTEQGKRKVLDSLKRSMQVDDGTAQYYLSISNGNPRAALSEFSEDLKWERQMSLA